MQTTIADAALGASVYAPPMRERTRDNIREDYDLVRRGILDPRSFREGYLAKANPVEIVVRHGQNHPNPRLRGQLKAIRRSHNVRTNAGGRWLYSLLGGNTSATQGTATLTGTATGVTATTLTNTGAAFPASTAVTAGNDTTNASALAGQVATAKNGLVGCIVVMGAAYGVVMSNTATVLTIDQWYAVGTNTGAVAATPAAGVYNILPGQAPAAWVALSNNATALTTSNLYTSDTSLPGEITASSSPTSGTGTGTGSGLLRSYVLGSSQSGAATAQTAATGNVSASYVYSKVWTAGSTGVWSITGTGLYLGSASGAPMVFENAMTLVSMSGPNADQATESWTLSLS